MFMRIVQTKVKSEQLPQMREHYERRVIPTLQKVPGCLFAGLLQSVSHPDECLSMTLWDDPGHVEAYERSGVFQELLNEARPYFSDSSEWKIQLSQDLRLEYEAVPDEPVVKSYSVTAQENGKAIPQEEPNLMFLRIVSPKIQPGKLEEFKRIYKREILPALQSVKGCRYAYLVEGMKENEEVISVSIWDSQRDAEDYERGGLFDDLKRKVRHTFSELYQWKMALQKNPTRQVTTSEDITIEGYSIVAGKSFR